MTVEYASIPNLRFLLHQVFNVAELAENPYFSEYNTEACDMLIDASQQLAERYLFPFYTEMDRQEPDINEEGELHVHSSVKPYLEATGEGGWIGANAPFAYGGMQMPLVLSTCTSFIQVAANNSSTSFTGLTTGAANLLISFATEEEKAYYLPPMFEGRWQGTMALTEPQAGSSLSDIITTAHPQEDGTYRIKGQKIYISGGEYSDAENVVHMLLARIDGAPRGTKGISLFIVPQKRLNGSHELVDNDVALAGVYHKMGQRGIPATHLMFGEKDDCHAYLVGEPHKGLSYMFQMMNEARIMVGLGACAIASAAYGASLKYANERPQGRPPGNKDPELQPQLIISHPDVRRMLLLQKSIMEGGLSLVMQCAWYDDMARVTEGEEKKNYKILLDLLTPVAKTYPSEMGQVSVSQGLQILGGGGFCKDFRLENYYRDIRIYSIYEGTTGIQSLDLLGRKIFMSGATSFQLLMQEIQKTLDLASSFPELNKYRTALTDELQRIQEVTLYLAGLVRKSGPERALADANLYMEFFGIVLVAWQWLKQACAAKQALLSANAESDEYKFYTAKLHTMKFYFAYEVPKTKGLATRLMDPEVLTMDTEPNFSF